MKNTLPKNLITVLDALILEGGKPIIVGGSVRDYLLNIACSDYDIEVYSIATLEELENILSSFGTVNIVGKNFGILKLSCKDAVYDFSFPRTENKTGLGHKEFSVTVNSDLSFDNASKRRDFTINAIGYDYTKKEFLDPFCGIKDLKNRVLKHIEDRSFSEDPLRVYRAVQFCGRFELTIDTNTKKLCESIVKTEDFKTLSKERIFKEYEKLLLQSKKPSIGLELLVEFNIIDISHEIMDSIDAMVEFQTSNHKENLVLMLYFLYDILLEISEDKQLLKTIEKLQKFQVPKIYENEFKNITKEVELLALKFKLMKSMPQPFLSGKDLISLGYKPSVQFGVILKKLYQSQLDGEIGNKKEGEVLLRSLL